MGKAEGTAGRARAAASGEMARVRAGGGSLTVDLNTRGTFSVSRIVDATPAGFDMGTGSAARRAAQQAYTQAATEIAYRRAAGQSVPKLTEVKKQIRRAYGLGRKR